MGIEKAQHTLIIVLFGEHKPLNHKELGLEEKYYHTRTDVTNIFEI